MNPLALAALIGLGLGAGGGWFFTDAILNAEISQMKADQAQALAAAETLYRERHDAEARRGDALSAQLAQTESQLTNKTLEVQRALSKVTTGRACFNAATVRLLNGAPRDDPTVPQAAGASATEGGAVATDTDVAGWIGGAQYQYDTCRARLGALIDYEIGRPDDRPDQQ
ncbi:hypothetical protein ACQE3D_10845 [Methylomonas sp. MS20]|uniref:hypothetical protein n=1 Tax=unclassified Methylomonas TaxID=2608980 RepID=UPI0028A53DD3|nr:hypothetical protein [Methylomonas sp. MV1]MDT4328505.1 hypothetical protein [Methylomonas sp. MV1]